MDISNLSSNWKKLQETLKTQPASATPPNPLKTRADRTRPPKRKAQPPSTNAANTGAKRQRKAPHTQSNKLNGKPARASMGGYLSKTTALKQDTEAGRNTAETNGQEDEPQSPKPAKSRAQAGKFIAIDCEMVGTTSTTIFSVKSNNNNDFSILARVSIVSYAQEVLYDTYVLPPSGVQVTDYRTKYSGITPWHLNPENTVTTPRVFEQVQSEVAALLHGRILVGHAINNDLAVLGLSHPKRSVRDTSSYPKYRALAAAVRRDGTPGKGRKPALKMLATSVLGYDIQNDETRGHDSVEDARATMALFQREKRGFEEEAVKRFGRSALAANASRPSPAGKVASPEREDDDNVQEETEDDDDDDEAADEAEIDNAEDINTGQTTAKTAKQKKKKKKKGKYRK